MKKRIASGILASALALSIITTMPTIVNADTYSIDELTDSTVLGTFSDDDLQNIADAITKEQKSRSEVETEIAETEIDIPITQREDYVERETVQVGDSGDNAKEIQARLIELGFLTGEADGNFGQKSQEAVKLFQEANGVEITGIADSISQYILFSENPVDKKAFESKPVQVGDGWEMTREFYYNSVWGNRYIFVLKNTSGYNAEISADVCFYDAEDNIVGVAQKTEPACENGYETFWSFSNDNIEYDHVSVDIKMSEEKSYKDHGQSNLDISSSVVGNKVIISATNNGEEPIQFVEYNILYLNSNNEVVSTGWGYITDDDSEIKAGATQRVDDTSYEDFTEVQVYAHGRISSW